MDDSTPTDVWIDTDTAIGVRGADVDDGLALVQAFHSPELCVRGVSSVFGNAPLEKTHPLAQQMTERFGPAGIPVGRGAASADDLGRPNQAVAALSAELERRPLAILAIGPLTNVGSLLRIHPELAERVRCIVAVAARRPGQAFLSAPTQPSPFPDFNFESDPAAMAAVLAASVALVFAPWEVSSHVWITADDLDALESGGEAGAFLARASRPWLEIWQRDFQAPGFNPFDTLAVGWLTHPELIEHFECRTWIEEAPGDGSARPASNRPQLLVEPWSGAGRRAIYCSLPAPAFKPMLLERLRG